MMVQWLRPFFHCQRPSFDPWSGNYDLESHMAWRQKKKKKSLKKKESVKALIRHSHFERGCLKKAMSKTNPGFAAQYLLNGEVLWRPSDQSAMSSIVLLRGQRNCIGRQSPWFLSPHSTLY